MDEYSGSGKRVVSGLGVAGKGPSFSFKDASNRENQGIQSCNRLGCSTRSNSIKGSEIGGPDRVKSSRHAFHSSRGKAIVGSSSKTYSAVNNSRRSHQEAQKFSSHNGKSSAETSCMQREAEVSELIPSTSSVETGILVQEDAEHISEEVGSYSVTSNTRPQKQIPELSKTCNLEISLGSSVRRSIGSSNTSQFTKHISHGQGSNTSRYGLRNFGCSSISDVLPSGCSSSDSSRSRRTDMKRRSLEGEGIAVRGKSISGSSTGRSSVVQRDPISTSSLSTSERSFSQQISRGSRNFIPSRDGVTSVRAQRTMNGNTRTRLSEHVNGSGNSLSPSETLNVIPPLPQTEIPTSGTIQPSSMHQIPAEVPTMRGNSYSRPGSSSENVRSRRIAHLEDGMTRSFHGLSVDHDRFRRFDVDGIAEVLLGLERIEQDEELTYEQLLVLETHLFLGGFSFLDQHSDMRLDIDNMSYEELLALEEKMGSVSTALTEDALSNCLKRSCYLPAPPDSGIIDCPDDDIKCSICQDEYVMGDEVGKLDCEHGYHVDCIHQWLRQKNWCPICKASALPSS